MNFLDQRDFIPVNYDSVPVGAYLLIMKLHNRNLLACFWGLFGCPFMCKVIPVSMSHFPVFAEKTCRL